jgi:GGDEF domain-containing protein
MTSFCERNPFGMDADKIGRFRDLALLELKRAERYRNFLSLLVLNLSELMGTVGRRKINSQEETKQFIDSVASRLKQSARETDTVSGFDNARLAMLLPETDSMGARVASERFQEMVSDLLSEFLESEYKFDVPLEITSFPDQSGRKFFKNRLQSLFHAD